MNSAVPARSFFARVVAHVHKQIFQCPTFVPFFSHEDYLLLPLHCPLHLSIQIHALVLVALVVASDLIDRDGRRILCRL